MSPAPDSCRGFPWNLKRCVMAASSLHRHPQADMQPMFGGMDSTISRKVPSLCRKCLHVGRFIEDTN